MSKRGVRFFLRKHRKNIQKGEKEESGVLHIVRQRKRMASEEKGIEKGKTLHALKKRRENCFGSGGRKILARERGERSAAAGGLV